MTTDLNTSPKNSFMIQGARAMTHTSSSSSLMKRCDIKKRLQTGPGRFSVCWLVLVCVIPSVRLCLQCDLAVRHMHEDFMASKHEVTVQEQMDLTKIIDHAYITYQDTSTQLSGVIDLTTLYRAQTEYESEFRRHWQELSTGSIQWDMIRILEKGKSILKKHLEVFVAEGLCPNKCGLLFQSVMNCSSCQYGLHICQSDTPPKDCGEHKLVAHEGEQTVLDCFLPWHSLVVGHAKYQYSWKRGATNFSAKDEFEVLVVTKDSKIVLNQLSVSEQGVYRCILLDQHGTTLSHTHFILTVIPMPTSPPKQIPTLPSVPDVDVRHVQPPKDILIIAVAFLTVLSLFGSLAVVMHLGMALRRQRKAEAEERVENPRWRRRD
ncbi:izumo sperm-egg fusion protein 1 isoform X2 [Ictalurus punctatus]|uniref:Izumo sperm-egg fusion protein 1 isoform X2 n=1 Tax=Ictalurus punctatus TaxID=7998 RepID=A0A2D0QYZ5_ICTPU|nr:izumo sperm-egg fusion protein 1 isoform X2 [Ictalurus punctatus]